MMIAVMIGALLIPAQGIAQNNKVKRGDKNVRVENRQPDRNNRGGKFDNRNDKGGKHNYSYNAERGGKPQPKPYVLHHHKPAPKPMPNKPHPRPVPHHHCHNNGSSVVGAAAVAIGVAGLISLLAD